MAADIEQGDVTQGATLTGVVADQLYVLSTSRINLTTTFARSVDGAPMLVPLADMSATLKNFHQHYNLYPLWICPHRHYDKEGHFLRRPLHPRFEDPEHGKYDMYVDLGAYGIPQKVLDKQPFDIVHENRAVEDHVHSVNGFQMLYADTYRTREEFRAMFDHTHYDAMREKYGGVDAFPEVFDKVKKRGFSLEAYLASKKDKRV